MAGRGKRSSAPRGGHRYPRSARVGETLREIIAEELVRIDDELNRAHVFFDSLAGEDGDADIVEALNRHRVRLQGAIADQIRAKKTPILDFRPDIALRSAERIDDILREDRKRHPDRPTDGQAQG